MKNPYTSLRWLFLGLLPLAFSSCLKDNCEATSIFYEYRPVFQPIEEVRAGFGMAAPRDLDNPGKIYVYQQYLLINELDQGIHLIDNSNPSQPRPVSFITIPGNVDMAVVDNVLYADSYVDLLAIDLRDPASPRLVNRVENVFPALGIDPLRGLITRFERTERRQEVPCDQQRGNWFFLEDALFVNQAVLSNAAGPRLSSSRAASIGIGGSMARFTIAKNHLYAVDQQSMHVFNIQDRVQPQKVNDVGVGWMIETIFPTEDHLFIGSQTGMYIYQITDPVNPEQLSYFQHANACDPVFVSGDIAFVTLRDGTPCQGFNNQLDVVDVANLRQPILLHTYPMHRPSGLSIAGEYLYLCEDDQGLKVFDISELDQINKRQVGHLKGFTAYDVITLDESLAIVVGKNGLYQFDIRKPEKIQQLSVLPVLRTDPK